jgi:hypothetical protein
MCTVTFIARQRGYALGMNRDEQLTRVAGQPPAEKILNGCQVVAPSEPGGGTWIALNERGVTFALINWYAITRRVREETISRGRVVNAVGAAGTPGVAEAALAQLPLQRINPFRLIGVFPAAGEIAEWRWDLNQLVCQKHRWKDQQWISSGWDEPAAQRIRGGTFRLALEQASAGSLGWLRRLHRSHWPQRGPFSICMHRADAATVSYTEVSVSPRQAAMRHQGGSPCACRNHEIGIQRKDAKLQRRKEEDGGWTRISAR